MFMANVVEAPLGVREYWYESFRRVVLVPEPPDCVLISIDVYRKYSSMNDVGFEPASSLEVNGIGVSYYRIPGDMLPSLEGLKPQWGELVVVDAGDRVEASDVRLYYCGVKDAEALTADNIYKVYRDIVRLIEGRDVDKNPLSVPKELLAGREPAVRV